MSDGEGVTRWFGIRTRFHYPLKNSYEDRITVLEAASLREALDDAALYGQVHALLTGGKFLAKGRPDEWEVFEMSAQPEGGSVVFVKRYLSALESHEFLDRYFDTGMERQETEDVGERGVIRFGARSPTPSVPLSWRLPLKNWYGVRIFLVTSDDQFEERIHLVRSRRPSAAIRQGERLAHDNASSYTGLVQTYRVGRTRRIRSGMLAYSLFTYSTLEPYDYLDRYVPSGT